MVLYMPRRRDVYLYKGASYFKESSELMNDTTMKCT